MKIKNKLLHTLFLWSISVVCAINAFPQANSEIQFRDQNTTFPIEGISFQYGEQFGVSNEKGAIEFSYNAGNTLMLSHINYGDWQLTDTEVKKGIEAGVIFWESISIDLYPATILMVRPNKTPVSNYELQYQDRLAHDGASVLLKNPTISGIRKGGNYGVDPVFRGFKYDQLNIVLNGVQCATAACPNRMDPPTSQMAPNMVDKVEILKGPHALRYGAGFGGTINFVPAKLNFTENTGVTGRLSGSYESNSNIYRSEGQVGFTGQKYNLGFFGSWSQGDDYKSGNGTTIPADFQRGSFGVDVGLKLAQNQQLRVSSMYNVARDSDFPALPMDLREDNTLLFNARHDIDINSQFLRSWNTSVFSSFVDHMMDNRLKPLEPRMMDAETTAKTHNFGGKTEGQWNFTKSSLYAGVDIRIEGAKGIRTREFLMGPNAGNVVDDNAWQEGQITKTGFFAEYHVQHLEYQFVFSGRLEINNSDISDPSPEFKDVNNNTSVTQVNPSFSLGGYRKFGSDFKTGIWLGRAQRSGSLTERFINYFPVGQDPYELVGDPQLKPEVNNQLDLNFEWKTKNTKIQTDVFVSYLQDFISSEIDTSLNPRMPTSPGVRQFVNIDEAFKTGFEINWIQDLVAGLQHQLAVSYTYAQDLDRGEPLPEIAPFELKYMLMGNYLKNKLHPEVTFRHVSEQSRISNEFGEVATPSFSVFDIGVTYTLSKIRLSMAVNNIFDKNYYEHLNRPLRGTTTPIYSPGRSVVASFSLNF